MRIKDIQVDGFGVWNNLKLDELPPGVTVLYGPNEAGKTTLMQFVRTVLYGFSPLRQTSRCPNPGARDTIRDGTRPSLIEQPRQSPQ